MKVIWLFPAGVLVGAALAWVFLAGLASEPLDLRAGGAPERPREPRSERSPPAPLSPVAVGNSDLHRCEVEPELAVTYWSALAVADAIAGHTERFIADAMRVLNAGGEFEGLLELIGHLPARERAQALERLTAAFPDRHFEVWQLSDLYLLSDQSELAFKVLLDNLEKGTEAPEAEISRLVDIDPVRAGTALLDIAVRHNWGCDLLIFTAEALARHDQGNLARPLLARALELQPANEEAVALMSAIDPAMAMELALAAVKAAPADSEAWSRLARLRSAAGDLVGAFEAYRQGATVEQDSDARLDLMRGMIRMDPMAALPLIRGLAEGGDDETLGILGHAYVAAGQEGAAFNVYTQAHTYDPMDSEWLHRMVALDPARAAREFASLIEASPGTDNDELIGTYALSLERQGKLAEAYDEYLRAWRLDEEDWEWMRGLARSNPGRAVQLFEEQHRENPEDGMTAGTLADAYVGLGRTTEAVRLYEQAIEAGQDSHRWMSALAAVEPARGLPMLKSAVDESPGDDELWGSLGDAYYRLGRMEDAKEAYDRALELDPSDWEWSVQRARIR